MPRPFDPFRPAPILWEGKRLQLEWDHFSALLFWYCFVLACVECRNAVYESFDQSTREVSRKCEISKLRVNNLL